MNIQFVTGVYGLLTYLASYLYKSEEAMSELMKKASKEATDKGIRRKLRKIGDVFLTKREIRIHEAALRLLSGPFRRSNIFVLYIPSGPQKDCIRMLKSRDVLDRMDSNDTNIFATNMIEKYVNCPDTLEDMCYADFATSYISKNVEEAPDEENIQNYTNPVNIDEEELQVDSRFIALKNGLGKMKKRRKCVMRYHKFSKFSTSKQYYMVLLQLHMPWGGENAIIDSFANHEDKFNDVFPNIEDNILEHEPYFGIWDLDDDDLENNSHIMEIDASHDNDNDYASGNEYSAFDSNLLDFDMDSKMVIYQVTQLHQVC